MARLAKSLITLKNQVDAEWPKRHKASDGWIGDAAHLKVASDHNPNPQGVVCALDLTHHAGYFDAHALADTLIAHRHPNLKYVISNRRIAGPWTDWKWAKYSGSNPHDRHIHISVGVGPDGQSKPPYDSVQEWLIKGGKVMDRADLDAVYLHGPLGRKRGRGEGEDVYLGKSAAFVLADHAKSVEARNRAKARADELKAKDALISLLQAEKATLEKQAPKPIDEKAVVEGWLKRLWARLFDK